MVHSWWGKNLLGVTVLESTSPLLKCQEGSLNCPGQVSRATRGKYSFLSLLFLLFHRTKEKKKSQRDVNYMYGWENLSAGNGATCSA